MRLTLPRLYLRLLVAVTFPLFLVTSTLLPVFHMHLETRLDGIRAEAKALLRAGEDALIRDINETLNYALAIAEMPTLQHQLAAQSPHINHLSAPSNPSQFATFLNTLISHSPRYSKLVLLDNQGNEVLRAPQGADTGPRVGNHNQAHTDYFQGASKLFPRDLYIPPPGRSLQYDLFRGEAVPVVYVTTPIFDAEGERQGIVLLSINWQHFTHSLYQSMQLQIAPQANVLLTDAQGRWLLTQGTQKFPHLSFGDDYASVDPESWQLLSRQNEGYANLDNHLLRFQTQDIRSQLYRSLAGRIFSTDETHPWKLGVRLPVPNWRSLIAEETTVLWFLGLIYATAVAFGIYWALSSHQQRKLHNKAQQQAAEVRDLYENAPCGYHSLDEGGTVIKMNQTELSWLGYSANDAIGRLDYRDVISPDTRDAFDATFKNVKAGQEDEVECTLVARDGSRRRVVIQASGYRQKGRFIHSRATVFDLTERKQLEEKLRAQAMTDPLTGVYNRRYLQTQAAVEMSRALRHNSPLSFIIVDIDYFKRINDEYGHDAGDEVLKHFTQVMSGLLRQEDLLCRVGGEEFAILLPNTDLAQAQQIAERIRTATADAQVIIEHEGNEQPLMITISSGVTCMAPHETTLKDPFKRADTGLYEAKEAGRNCIVVKRSD